jgi:drug/metabolite transporter (DMT)-like permease
MVSTILVFTPDESEGRMPTNPVGGPGLARGHLLVIGSAALFGVNASVSKVVLESGLPPARLTALRCTGAVLGLLVLLGATARGRLRVPLRDLPALGLLGLTGAALIQWLYFVAIDRLPVGIALLLEFTGPVLVALYARVVLGQGVHRQVWVALGLALGGLALVAQVRADLGLDPVGVAAGLGAATCLATFYLVGKSTVERHDPMTLSLWMFAFASLLWAFAQPWWNFDFGLLGEPVSLLGALDGIDVPMWLPLLWVVLLGTLAPYALQVAALRHLTPTTTGVVGMAEPVIAAAMAWLWLDEALTTVQILGGLLVLGGVALAQTARTPARRQPAPPPTIAPRHRRSRPQPTATTSVPASTVPARSGWR